MAILKKKSAILLIILFIMCSFPLSTHAASLAHLQTPQIDANLPDITVLLYFLDENDDTLSYQIDQSDIEATLGEDQLVVSDVMLQNVSEDGCTIFYLIDVSTSISSSELSAMKSALISAFDKKKENDHFVLVSFGHQITILLDGDESISDAKNVINSIEANEGETRLYQALNRVANIAVDDANLPALKSIFVISDGADYSKNSAVTQSEAIDQLTNLHIPIYAFIFSDASSSDKDNLSQLSRSTQGNMTVINTTNLTQYILEKIDLINQGLRISLKTPTNAISEAVQTLTIKLSIDDQEYSTSENIAVTKWKSDSESPTVEEIMIIDQNTINIYFSENVQSADSIESYTIKGKASGINKIQDVTYDYMTYSATIVTKDTIYEDEYTLTLSNIKDSSLEENIISPLEYQFEQNENQKNVIFYLKRFWWILLILIFVVLSISLILKYKEKRKNISKSKDWSASVKGEKIHISDEASLPVTITSVDKYNVQKKIETIIGISFIIGRSQSECDLSFDDDMLSRQHCALLYDGEILFIQDLNSMNGTSLNGIKINEKRPVNNGDIVLISNIKLIINY